MNKYSNVVFEEPEDIETIIEHDGVETDLSFLEEDIEIDEEEDFHYNIEECLHNECIPQ